MTAPLHGKAAEFHKLSLFSGIKHFAELERRIEALIDEKQKGDAFEVFAEAYLATQRVGMAKHVWPDKAIPPSIRKRLRLSARDVGADGVIETVSGKCRAYQVKFRSGRAPLTWTDTATFFGVTDHCDDRLLFTNSEDVSKVAEQRKDFSSIRGTDLDSLTAEDFDAIHAWLAGKTVTRKKSSPRPYQQRTLDAILQALNGVPQVGRARLPPSRNLRESMARQEPRPPEIHDRATAVMACGTGKTFVALWAAEAIAKRTVLVLVPSLALLRQTLREWVKNTAWEPFDYLCVCSDPTVSQGDDELVMRPTELEFSVSTQPEQVREFLAHSFAGVKIIFSTYQSADVVARGMPRNLQFDIGIFDEAHKTAGREGAKFSFALKDDNLPIRKRLFLTATPRHYDLRKRDKEGEPIEVYSMNRPEIYGPVVHTLSFAEAAKQKIICNYKVVISVVTPDMLTPHRAGHPKGRGGSRASALRQDAENSRVVQKPENHRDKLGGAFQQALRHGTVLVNGGLVTEFKAARQAVMSNARCLTEGIDMPTVDMVAFLTIVGRRRRAGRVRRSLGRVAGPARTGRSARRPDPPDAGRASAHERFQRFAAARTSRGSRPHADARQAASSHRHPLPGPPRPPVGRDGSMARTSQRHFPKIAVAVRRPFAIGLVDCLLNFSHPLLGRQTVPPAFAYATTKVPSNIKTFARAHTKSSKERPVAKQFLCRFVCLVAVLLVGRAVAIAQTAAGDLARGQGAYLKGLGSYNLNTAQGNSINVDSMIRWKSDLRKIQRERWNREAELAAGKKLKKEEVLQMLLERERQLRVNPAIEDVLKGDALNVLVYDLTDPDIKLEDWSSKTVSLPPGTSVKDLIFRFTPQSKQGAGATALSKGVIALSRLDIKGKWPTFMNIPALDSAKSAYENAYLKVRDEILADKPPLNSLLAMDRTLDALKDKVKEAVPAERDYRAQGLKFVDDLKAATRMFDAGSVDYAKDILNDTKDGDATTVAELVSFMLKYRLQFATSDRSPAATELYPKLYQALQQQAKELGIKPPEVPPMAEKESLVVEKNSVWVGDKFPQKLTITERNGQTFQARFEVPNGYIRDVKGEIKGNKLSWLAKDVRAVKGSAGSDNHGTIGRDEKGDKIDFVWGGEGGGSGTFTLRLRK